MRKKLYKALTGLLIGVVGLVIILFIVLAVYARNPYQSLPEMQDAIELLDLEGVTVYEDGDEIRYTVDNPLKQIVFIPGGLVEPDSYEYLAAALAANGYNVVISKAYFDLAILTPRRAKKFLSADLENVIIGHSLGGVVGSMVASGNDLVDQVILLGSYPINDLTDKDVLIISAEHDLGMNQEEFDASLIYVNEDTSFFHILGGNHAQFGWYGPQKGDGDATLTTNEQQTLVINKILEFLGN